MPRKSSKSMNLKLNNSMCFCIVVFVLLCIAVYFVLRDNGVMEGFAGELNTSGSLNNVLAKPNPSDDEFVLILVYVDWCPHCKTVKPDWKKLIKNYNNKNVNGKNVKVVSANAEGSEVEKNVANDLNVQGFPTIKGIHNSKVNEYNGARNYDELEKFINEECS